MSPFVSLCVWAAGLTAAAPAARWFAVREPREARAAAGGLVRGLRASWVSEPDTSSRPGSPSSLGCAQAGLRGAREVGRGCGPASTKRWGRLWVGVRPEASRNNGKLKVTASQPSPGPQPALRRPGGPASRRGGRAGPVWRHCVHWPRRPRHPVRHYVGPAQRDYGMCQWGSPTPQAHDSYYLSHF